MIVSSNPGCSSDYFRNDCSFSSNNILTLENSFNSDISPGEVSFTVGNVKTPYNSKRKTGFEITTYD